VAKYLSYAKEKIHIISGAGVCLILLEVGDILLIRHLIEQWSHDRDIGIFHILIGGVAAMMGVAGGFFILDRQYRKKDKPYGKWLGRLLLGYAVVQVGAGILQGILGELLYTSGTLGYEEVKGFLYLLSGLIQSVVRITFIYMLVTDWYGRGLKKEKRVLFLALGMGTVLYIMSCVLRLILSGGALQTVRLVWEILYPVIFITYFGERMREEKENA